MKTVGNVIGYWNEQLVMYQTSDQDTIECVSMALEEYEPEQIELAIDRYALELVQAKMWNRRNKNLCDFLNDRGKYGIDYFIEWVNNG